MLSKTLDSKKAGSGKSNEPRPLCEILTEYFASNEPLAVAYRHRKLFEDIFPHTEPCCELKLFTRQPGRLNEGTMLDGIIARDGGERYVFVQNGSKKKVTTMRRTPIIFSGGCINVHRLDDGTLRLDFNHPRFDSDFSFRDFCLAAAQELLTIACLFGEDAPEE